MTEFVTNIITNSLSGLLTGVVATAGGVAGDAVAGIGDFIESSGQTVGNGISNKFDSWGQGVASYGGNAAKSGKTIKPAASKTTGSVRSAAAGTKKATAASTSTQKAFPAAAKRPMTASTTNPKAPMLKSAARSTNSVVQPRVTTSLKASPLKASANTSGKVVPQKQSLPAAKRPIAGKGPAASKQDYKGPLGLADKNSVARPSNTSIKGYQPNAGFVPASNNHTSVKPAAGGYKGPLALGSLS